MGDPLQERFRNNAPYSKSLPSPPKYSIPPVFADRPDDAHLEPQWDSLLPQDFKALPAPYAQWKYEYRQRAQHVAPCVVLGPSSVAKEPEVLKKLNISRVLIVRRAAKDFAARITPASFRISREAGLQTELVDVQNYQQLASKFAAISAALHEFVQTQPESYIFVCCESGNDLSAAIVVAYVMTRYQVSMVHAVQIVQLRRFCIGINEELQRLLDSYQAILRARLDLVVTAASTKQKRGFEDAGASENDDSERFSGRTLAPFSDC